VSAARWAQLAVVLLCACSDTTDLYAGSDVLVMVTAPPQAGADAATAPPPAAGMAAADPLPPVPDASTVPLPDAEPPAPACDSGRGDCDADRNNGCEVDLLRDPAHCGGCGQACTAPDCACEEGRFTTVCPAGRADCDADPDNGCEVDTDTDLAHCGGCERPCHTNGHDALDATCIAGRCELECENDPIEIDCDGDPDNGCETYVLIDDDNCGACGVRCSCQNGTCM
jgi:hypothetical protein